MSIILGNMCIASFHIYFNTGIFKYFIHFVEFPNFLFRQAFISDKFIVSSCKNFTVSTQPSWDASFSRRVWRDSTWDSHSAQWIIILHLLLAIYLG